MTNLETRRKRLLAKRAELEDRLKQIEDWLDDPVNPNAEERATERELDEVHELQGLAGQEEIAAIDAAIKRMENNIYGECLKCGEPISDERLDAVPYATLCRNCME
ncbi:TraR/DksA family transcriptional regulator [Hoeflea prorocentri]|uniref:TraR/DksA family transcriptional regulator n=1 Tax=Hoeflea prorocentri TaxID=1922333 RepID=A0A9X3UF23_9HYPH|nr:TraR/DksA family transcriptional regulator [Hoeflea prorocentri]MCY6379658.1 TraR/DksA family transcriptional regulator [Hoeflea prorocentri]MDA5397458.1 TraR/DksA family transcriptional regulator [Hoeflea prorocentri]